MSEKARGSAWRPLFWVVLARKRANSGTLFYKFLLKVIFSKALNAIRAEGSSGTRGDEKLCILLFFVLHHVKGA